MITTSIPILINLHTQNKSAYFFTTCVHLHRLYIFATVVRGHQKVVTTGRYISFDITSAIDNLSQNFVHIKSFNMVGEIVCHYRMLKARSVTDPWVTMALVGNILIEAHIVFLGGCLSHSLLWTADVSYIIANSKMLKMCLTPNVCLLLVMVSRELYGPMLLLFWLPRQMRYYLGSFTRWINFNPSMNK